MIEFVNRLPKSSGKELDKPVQITLAPTGVAAFIVHGTTIESGLGIQPNNRKSHISNNASRNADLQFLYQDLRVIFIDEIREDIKNNIRTFTKLGQTPPPPKVIET